MTGNGERPAIPALTIGLRLSPRRFAASRASIAALEPGVGTDLGGGLWLERTVLGVAARF